MRLVVCDCCGCETDTLYAVHGEGLLCGECFLRLPRSDDDGMRRFAKEHLLRD